MPARTETPGSHAMYIFALDSSGAACSAAILEDERPVASAYLDVGLTHSQTLLPLCERVFASAGLTPRDVDLFAATSGPGSFTGLRIGMATIKGFAFENNTPCAAVPTSLAMASACRDFAGCAVCVSDARAGRVYAAVWRCGATQALLKDDTAVPLAELPALLENITEPIIFVGDAALMCYNDLKDKRPCRLACAANRLPRAEYAAQAAMDMFRRGEYCECGLLTPRYLQLPQAERQLLQKQNSVKK